MTALTTADIGTGWFILTAALLTLGPLTMWFVRRDVKAEALAKEAVRIVTTPNPGAVRFEAECTQALAIAAHTSHAMSRIAAIPVQRQPFDQEEGGRR